MANLFEEKIKGAIGRLSGSDDFKKEMGFILERTITESTTSSEKIDAIAKGFLLNSMVENNQENVVDAKIEAKKLKIEFEKLKEERPEDLIEFKRQTFKKELETKTKELNPNLTPEQAAKVGAYGDLVSEVYFNKDQIDLEKSQEQAFEENKKSFSPGQMENGWSDLQGIVGFLKKSPDKINSIKESFNSLKSGLSGVELPTNMRPLGSFEKIISSFNNPELQSLFFKTQGMLNGNLFNQMAINVGQQFVNKIGNQAVKEFATNALGIFAKEGFQKGAGLVLKGVLSGGVKTAVATAGGAATGGIATIVMAALEIFKKIKGFLGKIAEKLGINIKGFLEENFGKVGGKILGGLGSMIVIIPALLIGAVGAVMMVFAPMLIAVIGGTIIYNQSVIDPMAASVVPPKEIGDAPIETNDNWDGIGCINKGYPSSVTTKSGENGVIFYIFEPGNRRSDGRMNQLYDLSCTDHDNLVSVDSRYSNYSGNRLDRRVLSAFYALYNAGQTSGLGEGQLKLTSGYRSNEEQANIRQDWKNRITTVFNQGKCSGDNWNCEVYCDSAYNNLSTVEKIEKCTSKYAALPGSSNHLTGRALDLAINNDFKTFNWLVDNGYKYGFYNYSAEKWHWEYNPAP